MTDDQAEEIVELLARVRELIYGLPKLGSTAPPPPPEEDPFKRFPKLPDPFKPAVLPSASTFPTLPEVFKSLRGENEKPAPPEQEKLPDAELELTGDPRKDIFNLATVASKRLGTDVWAEIKSASGFTGDSGDFVWLEPNRLRSVRKDSKWARNTINRLKRKLNDLNIAASEEEVTF